VGIEALGQLVAFGIVNNISERGVCLATHVSLGINRPFVLALSFPGQHHLSAVPARVVWTRQQDSGERQCGMCYEMLAEPTRQRLATLIGTC
jgi:hypothetical protein